MAGGSAGRPPQGARSGPGAEALAALLGKAAPLWEGLLEELVSDFGPVTLAWSHSARTQNWLLSLKTVKGKRAVVTLIPHPGHLVAAFALGEKAVAAAREGGLPREWLEAIEAAPRYGEGRGVWLTVRTRKDAAGVRRLAAIRLAQ
jgi:hypothetical protein